MYNLYIYICNNMKKIIYEIYILPLTSLYFGVPFTVQIKCVDEFVHLGLYFAPIFRAILILKINI